MATADTRAIALVLALKEELPVFQLALTDKLKTVATAKNPIGAMKDKIVRTELLDSSFDIKASIEALLQTKLIETMLTLVNSIDTKKNLDAPTKQKVYEVNTLVEIYKTYFKNFQIATKDPIQGRMVQSYYYLIKTIKAVDAITDGGGTVPAADITAFTSFKRFIQLKAYADILAADLQQMKTILEERKARDPKKDSSIPGMASGFKPSSIAKIQTATDLLEQTDEKSMQGMIQIAAKLQRMQYPAVDLVFLATGLAKYMKDYLTTGALHKEIFKKFQPDNKLYPIPLFILQLPILGYKPDGSNLTGTPPGAPLSNGIQGEAPATDGSMKLRMTSDKELDPGTPGSNPISTPGQTTGSTTDLSSANEQDLALAKRPKGRTIRSYGLEDIPVPPIGTPIPDDWKNIDPYRVFANQYNLINASQTKGDAWAKKILNEIINNDCFSDPNIMYSTTCPNLRDYLYEMSMASLTGEFTMEPPEIPTNQTYGIVGIKLVIGLDALETSLDPAPELQGLTGFSRDITKKFLAIRKKVRALLNPPGVGGSGGLGGSSGGLGGSSGGLGGSSGGLGGSSGGLGGAGTPDFAATMKTSIDDIRSALRGLGVVT
jgi:hypothetical protein